MRYIFAAFAVQHQKQLHPYTKDVLETYVNHRKGKDKFTSQLQDVIDIGGTMFLDSGAFSAWTKNEVIDIDRYAEFALRYQDKLECIASLDVIPGRWGQIPGPKEVEDSARKGFENYLYLLEKGLDSNKLLHIFHQGEDFFWLREMMQVCPYFGISPANDRTTEQKIQWLEQVMRVACTEDGMPVGKWHGFGVTSFDIMYRYSWYSCDSSTWLRPGAFGNIYWPQHIEGLPSYAKAPRFVAVSPRSSAVQEMGKHYTTLTVQEQEQVREFVQSLGFTIEQLAEDYRARHLLNIAVTKNLIAAIPPYPWAYKTVQESFV